jgi:hypothetical protein
MVVMVLQRLEGLSDREAVERFAFDLRWKYAAGGLDIEYPSFVHTVLVDMRARLRRSNRPDRVFEVVLKAAKAAGLVGRKRVLDSTPLYDAVATQDTVTMIRSAICGLLRESSDSLKVQLLNLLERDDDYTKPGKPSCDWDDAKSRLALVDALSHDAYALLSYLNDKDFDEAVTKAATLLATVVGQDIEETDGVFRIARRVAQDRVISTVDPEARHGHKTEARSFDGYKGHISVDPDSEIITAAEVTPANVGDGAVVKELLCEALSSNELQASSEPIEIYGDAAYGSVENLTRLNQSNVETNLKVREPTAGKGKFSKNQFTIDIEAGIVTCPNDQTAFIYPRPNGAGMAIFGNVCLDCPLQSQCTQSKDGRSIYINAEEKMLSQERQRQKEPEWKTKYKAIRPKVERKIAHLMKHRHGGRRARVRGVKRIAQDFSLLAAVTNLKRLAFLTMPGQQLVCP